MAALSPRVSPAELPDVEVTAQDVRKVRFALALRGYRMSDVDWTLERVADEITRLRAEIVTLRGTDLGDAFFPDDAAQPAMFPAEHAGYDR